MTVDDLLALDAGLRRLAVLPEMDPLTGENVLQEAQVLDLRFDAKRRVVGVMFELRTALQLREGNTGVLVASGVHEVAWAGPRRDTALTAWPVGSSVPGLRDGLFKLSLVCWPHPGALLRLTAEAAAFFVGQVLGLPEAPPDYVGIGPTQLADGVAYWGSTFVPLSAVFLDVAPMTSWSVGSAIWRGGEYLGWGCGVQLGGGVSGDVGQSQYVRARRGELELVGDEPVPELRFIGVHIEGRVGQGATLFSTRDQG